MVHGGFWAYNDSVDSAATKYYNLATCVLILYDYFLTFDMEVEKIWMQRWTLPKSLWFVVSQPVYLPVIQMVSLKAVQFRYLTPAIQIGSVCPISLYHKLLMKQSHRSWVGIHRPSKPLY